MSGRRFVLAGLEIGLTDAVTLGGLVGLTLLAAAFAGRLDRPVFVSGTVAQESGWSLLRQELSRVYTFNAESFRPRQEWLTEQLLGQVQRLVKQLATRGGLPIEQSVDLADLIALSRELELNPRGTGRPVRGCGRWNTGYSVTGSGRKRDRCAVVTVARPRFHPRIKNRA